jgi:VWFA-related protein
LGRQTPGFGKEVTPVILSPAALYRRQDCSAGDLVTGKVYRRQDRRCYLAFYVHLAGSMRVIAAMLLCACAAFAQFRSTVPLVVAPTTIKDAQGHFVDGLTPKDLVLYDNNVPQTIQMDWMAFPISLVVLVQTSSNSRPILDKLSGSAPLFTDLVAADAGETALITFSDTPHLRRNFTADAAALKEPLQKLRTEGDNACVLESMREALRLLAARDAGRRRVILLIAEKRDRGSQVELTDVVREIQRQNVAVYWLTYSPFLQAFSNKPKNPDKFVSDAQKKGKTEEEWRKEKQEQDDWYLKRNQPGPGDPFYALKELVRMKKPDLADLFTRTTGATTMGFLERKALETAIQQIGEEVHRQYILTFQPHSGDTDRFHTIRVEVKDHPELQVKTREGYWPVQ